jgi:large subunit ribosomal protein L9
LAAIATKNNVKRIEHEKRAAQARAVKQRASAQALADKLSGVSIALTVQVGEDEKLYGSITSRDVEEALAAQGFEVDRRKIIMQPIKELGSHTVQLKVASGVDAEIKVEVSAKSA